MRTRPKWNFRAQFSLLPDVSLFLKHTDRFLDQRWHQLGAAAAAIGAGTIRTTIGSSFGAFLASVEQRERLFRAAPPPKHGTDLFFRKRMMRFDELLKTLRQHMRVDLSRRDIGVSKQ